VPDRIEQWAQENNNKQPLPQLHSGVDEQRNTNEENWLSHSGSRNFSDPDAIKGIMQIAQHTKSQKNRMNFPLEI
jgi:hypothetical protein